MLVVARKAGQTIVLPELGITFKVVRLRSAGIVLIAVDAPKNIAVHRGEIADLIAQSAHPPASTEGQPAPVQIWSRKTGRRIATATTSTITAATTAETTSDKGDT